MDLEQGPVDADFCRECPFTPGVTCRHCPIPDMSPEERFSQYIDFQLDGIEWEEFSRECAKVGVDPGGDQGLALYEVWAGLVQPNKEKEETTGQHVQQLLAALAARGR